MAQLDPNQYKAVWKHKTPLNSDYLNILLEGQEPGLVSLPTITPGTSSVTVGSFSAFVQPVDDSGDYLPNEIMKVVVTQDTVVTVVRDTNGTAKTRGIGLKVVKTETETRILIDAVDAADCATYKGIFIASVLYPYNTSNCWATVNGADYSDILLTKLGYDPSFWVSPVSPRRNVGYDANVNNLISLWEIRYHNNIYDKNLGSVFASYDDFPLIPVINQGGESYPALGFANNTTYDSKKLTDKACWNLYSSFSDKQYQLIYIKRIKYSNNDTNVALSLNTGYFQEWDSDQSSTTFTHLGPFECIPMIYSKTNNTYTSIIKPVKIFYGLYININFNELRVQ